MIFSVYPQIEGNGNIALTPPLPWCVLQRYDWSSYVVMPPNANGRSLDHTSPRGAQMNKFGTADTDYVENPEAVQFVGDFMPDAVPFTADTHALLYGALVALANFPDGVAVDLGAGVFKSSNLIGAVFAHGVVFACDTFTGLPYEWKLGNTNFSVGTFAPKCCDSERQPPFPTLDNVVAVKGQFKDTVPCLVPMIGNRPLALVHIDSDTYQSAIDGLTPLLPILRVGTVLVFDEFYNYEGFEDGEYRAFLDLIVAGGFGYAPLAFNRQHQQVVIQITSLPFENMGVDEFPSDL
jgi:hypothetical protein